MEKTLEQIVDEGIYMAMLEERPSLVEAVGAMVACGQLPTAIEAEMQKRFGREPHGRQMVRNVRHIANHISLLLVEKPGWDKTKYPDYDDYLRCLGADY